MAENRLNRDLETREKTSRKRNWVRPDTLPTPTPEPGYEFHWVRISTRGQADPMNVSLKLREGWEPVKAADHPEIFLSAVENFQLNFRLFRHAIFYHCFFRKRIGMILT